ncbi:hypothetical protein AB0K51_07845 [Kitasatospora sp. NPDC049285]|uniref:hypothetical protein n=1 Tax=Kitasatospora sp. NPDC049285 TaxID=3157096 RepID=UPI003435A020
MMKLRTLLCGAALAAANVLLPAPPALATPILPPAAPHPVLLCGPAHPLAPLPLRPC